MICAGKGTTVEVLACMGLFGLFWSSIQAVGLEHEAVRQVAWTPQVCVDSRNCIPHACSLRCAACSTPLLRAQHCCMPRMH